MHVRATVMAFGAAAGLMLVAASAGAQDYYGDPSEEVIVTPPHYVPPRSFIRAPIIDVSMSRAVRFDDLDLRADWGARALRGRVIFAATTLCGQLNTMYPVSYDGTGGQWPRDHNCFHNAVAHAMVKADAAISAARGYDYRP
jgi:UrcA family protein